MKLPVPVPGRPQQGAIADYLDAETARIDALITMKRRLVDLLGQWRFATLQRVLCPGQTVSGYLQAERLGDAGAVQLKRLLQRTIAGGTPASDNSDFWAEPDDEGAHPWLAIGDMVDRGVTRSTAKALSREGLQACRLQPAPPGVLLFAMYASLGKLTITGGPAVWNQAIVGLVPAGDRALTKYLAYWLELIRPYLASLARSTTQDNLNAEQVGDLPVRAVPLAEQAAMVDRLDEAFAALATTAAGLADQIGLLVERRQALITAVVTGELAVPGAV